MFGRGFNVGEQLFCVPTRWGGSGVQDTKAAQERRNKCAYVFFVTVEMIPKNGVPYGAILRVPSTNTFIPGGEGAESEW